MDHSAGIDFEPITTQRASEQVAAVLQETIVDGRLQPGDRLPPERTLAHRFGVTRNTVREALRKLEHSRLVSIRQGRGVTVQDYLGTAGLDLLAALLGTAPSRRAMADLLEARAVIGSAVLGFAVQRVPLDRLGAFHDAVRAFAREARAPRPRPRRLQQLELELHQKLIRALGNRAFVLLWNSIGRVYARVAPLFTMVVAEPLELAGRYQQVSEALGRRDRAAASEGIEAIFRAPSARDVQAEPC